MSSCATVPTETQFSTQTISTSSLSTSFSISQITDSPTLLTTTISTCLDTKPVANTCLSPAVTSTVITQPGATRTISSSVVVTVPTVLTSSIPTKTLFSTSCTPTASTPTTPTTSTAPPTSTSPSDAPTPVIFTSASSLTLGDGSIVTTNITVTSTVPPPAVIVTSIAPSFNNGGGGSRHRIPAPIVGGVVGGVVGLLAIIAAIWYLWWRSKRWDDIFDQEEDDKVLRRRMSLDGVEDIQPKPYHYGLVGHSSSPTPPGSPPLRPSHSPSNSLSLLNAPPLAHSRTSSGASIDDHGATPRSGSEPTPTSGHIRPNTSSSSSNSIRPLLERPVNVSRPQSSRSLHTQGRSIGSGTELFESERPTVTRPGSAGSAPSTTAAVSPYSNEKRRLVGTLPPGAAAPISPTPAIPIISSPGTSAAPKPPPLKARNPRRPSSSGQSGALIDVDENSTSAHGPQPPAYSPT